jgi:hypothetical protein
MAGGLAIMALGKRPASEPPGAPEDDAVENDLLDEAFRAVKQNDPAAFRTAMREMVETCIARHKDGDY